jgi:predicted Ser/Thr protein kinase
LRGQCTVTLADSDLTLPINQPRLRTYNRLTAIAGRAFFYFAATCGLVAIYMLACPFGPAFVCANPDAVNFAIVAALAIISLGALMQFGRWACSNEMTVNRDGLVLPFLIGRFNQMPTWQSWTGVASASIADDVHGERCLLLQLKSGKSIVMPVAGVEPHAIERLLLSIELWASGCVRSQSLLDYQSELHNDNKGIGQLSYTEMWNDELGRRFTSTTFVPLEPGAKLQNGKLTVMRQLAFGGLSAIYLVQDGQKEMRVLKEANVPAAMEVKDHGAAERALQREAEILSQLQHPNIVQVLDNFAEGGQHYLLLQHVTGQDLRQLVRQNGPQPQDKVLDWAVQIASALEYLHTWDPPIIHRDLTPENIVLKNDGTIVIIDFGASNQFLATMTGTIVGKQAYMAPEQLQGHANTQSDIYAFGGTLHFLLTGKDPVPLSQSHPAKFANVAQDLDDLVSRLTSLDIEARCKSISTAKAELMGLYSAEGIAKLFTGGV